MHWLPLVAMVIASALLYSHNLVPSFVAATTELRGSPDNHRNSIGDGEYGSTNDLSGGSYSHSPASRSSSTNNMAESEALIDYNSQSNDLSGSTLEDYSQTGEVTERNDQSNAAEDLPLRSRMDYKMAPSVTNLEHRPQDVQKQTIRAFSSDLCNSTQNSTSTEDLFSSQGQLGLPNTEDFNPQGNIRQVHDKSLDYNTPDNYKSQRRVTNENYNFADMTRKKMDHPLNAGKDKNLKVTDISVRQDYSHIWDGTENTGLSLSDSAHEGTNSKPGMQMKEETAGEGAGRDGEGAVLVAGGEKLLGNPDLFLDAQPRVLFTPSPSPPKHPPLLLMLEAGLPAGIGHLGEGEGEELEEEGGQGEELKVDGGQGEEGGVGTALLEREGAESMHHKSRPRRASPPFDRRGRGERAVCEVASEWVTDKKTAIDIMGNTVTVLPEIQTPRGSLKQYFFETKCRSPDARGTGGSGVSGRDCVGVDKKHWVSECKAKQSYVRALTTHPQKGLGWRWIRIDSSCVCVLQARVPRN